MAAIPWFERCVGVTVLALVSIAAAPGPTRAAPPNGCAHWRQRATTQAEMDVCSARDAERSSRDVAKRYLEYRETLAGGRRNALDASQRAWAKYRETYCAEKALAVAGGSMQSMVISTCVDTLNRRRALDLANDRAGP